MALVPFGFGPLGSSIFDPFDIAFPSSFSTPASIFPIATALSFPRSTVAADAAQLLNTRIDWRETPEAHVFKVDLPGLRKEEVRVEVEDGRVLQISGERTREEEEVSDTWHRVERSVGKFLRRFRLPENAKVDQVKATMESGVLTVTVPKEEVKRPEVRAIQISTTA